jgi:hypothetical protein
MSVMRGQRWGNDPADRRRSWPLPARARGRACRTLPRARHQPRPRRRRDASSARARAKASQTGPPSPPAPLAHSHTRDVPGGRVVSPASSRPSPVGPPSPGVPASAPASPPRLGRCRIGDGTRVCGGARVCGSACIRDGGACVGDRLDAGRPDALVARGAVDRRAAGIEARLGAANVRSAGLSDGVGTGRRGAAARRGCGGDPLAAARLAARRPGGGERVGRALGRGAGAGLGQVAVARGGPARGAGGGEGVDRAERRGAGAGPRRSQSPAAARHEVPGAANRSLGQVAETRCTSPGGRRRPRRAADVGRGAVSVRRHARRSRCSSRPRRSRPAASRHSKVPARNASAGQAARSPCRIPPRRRGRRPLRHSKVAGGTRPPTGAAGAVQASATSHSPAAARHSRPAAASASAGHVASEPVQVSRVALARRGADSWPADWSASAGQVAPEPVQVSGGRRGPPGRGTRSSPVGRRRPGRRRRSRCSSPRGRRRPPRRAGEGARPEGIRRARGARPSAGLREVAPARRGAALEACRMEGIRRARSARAGARLRHVAVARRWPAGVGVRPEGVGRAGGARARAHTSAVSQTAGRGAAGHPVGAAAAESGGPQVPSAVPPKATEQAMAVGGSSRRRKRCRSRRRRCSLPLAQAQSPGQAVPLVNWMAVGVGGAGVAAPIVVEGRPQDEHVPPESAAAAPNRSPAATPLAAASAVGPRSCRSAGRGRPNRSRSRPSSSRGLVTTTESPRDLHPPTRTGRIVAGVARVSFCCRLQSVPCARTRRPSRSRCHRRPSPAAPTTAVSCGEWPRWTRARPYAAASPAVSLPCWLQGGPRPHEHECRARLPSSPWAPTPAVSPESATEVPNKSPPAASLAVSLRCCSRSSRHDEDVGRAGSAGQRRRPRRPPRLPCSQRRPPQHQSHRRPRRRVAVTWPAWAPRGSAAQRTSTRPEFPPASSSWLAPTRIVSA